MRTFYLILLIIVGIFVVTFSQFNAQNVTIRYYYIKDIDVPAYMLIFVSLLVGVIITSFLGVVERFRLNRTISRLNKVIRDLRKELRSNDPPPIIHEPKHNPAQEV